MRNLNYQARKSEEERSPRTLSRVFGTVTQLKLYCLKTGLLLMLAEPGTNSGSSVMDLNI